MAKSKEPFFQTLKDTLSLSGRMGRRGFVISCLMSVFNSFLEIFTLATAIPLILYYIARPENPQGKFVEIFEQILNHSLFNNSIINVLLALALLLLIKNLVGTFISYYQIRLSFGVASSLSEQLLKSYYDQPYLEYTAGNSGEHHNEINNAPAVFSYNAFLGYINIFSELAVVFILCIGLIIVSPYIFLVTTSFFAVISLAALWIKNRYARKISHNRRSLYTSTSKSLMKALDVFVMVRLFQKDQFFINAYAQKLRSLQAESVKDRVLQNLPMRILELTGFLGVIILMYLFNRTGKSTVEMTTILGLFATAAYRIIPSFNKLISQSVNIKSNHYALEILKKRLHKPEVSEKKRPDLPDDIESISVQNLGISYDSKTVLQDLSLSIRAGEVVGITGESGAGKSTLFNVLIGLIEPDRGQTLLNDEAFEPYKNPKWFEKIAFVGQNPVILDGSIASNIAFGVNPENVDESRIESILKQVGLARFCGQGQHGIFKEVGENGAQLSGGEKRRIALARALYKEPEVFFFDEITNDLDQVSANLIYELLQTLSKSGKVVIWITHDQSGMRFCTRLIDLEKKNLSNE